MANSPSHRFGQIIGNYFESSIEEFLSDYVDTQSKFYLDKNGPREARGGKKSLKWSDDKGNSHKLDYVIERNGSNEKFGELVAIIEVAWRSYTKHSKNKAQEIEGAVTSIVKKYSHNKPFTVAILAGDFTIPSLEQLKSHQFDVVYFDKSELGVIFSKFGINIKIEENTPDEKIDEQVKKYEDLSESNKIALKKDLKNAMGKKMNALITRMGAHLNSEISQILIGINYSENLSFKTIQDSIDYLLLDGEIDRAKLIFSDYFIIIEYSSGTRIEIRAISKEEAISHLEKFQP